MTVRWVSTHVAAIICHVTPQTIRRWCEDGLIPPAHCCQTLTGNHWRIDPDHVRHLLIIKMDKRREEGAA